MASPVTAYFIAPEFEIKKDIAKAHHEYLRRHGGHRAKTQDSNRHAITVDRLERWRDNWAAIGL